jgi:hypothetical protein
VDCVIVLCHFHHDIISLGTLKDQKEKSKQVQLAPQAYHAVASDMSE